MFNIKSSAITEPTMKNYLHQDQNLNNNELIAKDAPLDKQLKQDIISRPSDWQIYSIIQQTEQRLQRIKSEKNQEMQNKMNYGILDVETGKRNKSSINLYMQKTDNKMLILQEGRSKGKKLLEILQKNMNVGCGQENQQVIWCSVYCIASNLTLDLPPGEGQTSSKGISPAQLRGSRQPYESLTEGCLDQISNSYLELIQEDWIIWFKTQEQFLVGGFSVWRS